jgi:hypothetical protein
MDRSRLLLTLVNLSLVLSLVVCLFFFVQSNPTHIHIQGRVVQIVVGYQLSSSGGVLVPSLSAAIQMVNWALNRRIGKRLPFYSPR